MDVPGFEFAPFRVDLADARLFRGHTPLALRPKTFAVLRLLLERHGKLVSKHELIDTVWPDVAVGDAVLKGCIRELRDALGDDPAAPRYVETAHRLGYRFIAPLRAPEPSAQRVDAHTQRAPHGTANGTQEGFSELASSAGLVGRDHELRALDECLARARTGERQMLLVEGEPGEGKSALLGALVARAAASGVRTLLAHCIDQFGAGEPFMPILEALEAGGADAAALAARVSDGGGAAGGPVAGSAAGLVRALAHGIEQLAGQAGLVLVVEDLHWSDAPTLALLALLAQRSTPCPILVALSYRPIQEAGHGPLSAFVHELSMRGRATRLTLAGLTADAVRELLARRAARELPLAELSAVIHARTGGNALFVRALLDDLSARGRLREAPGDLLLDEVLAQLPDRLGALITARLRELAPAERRVVELLSVAAVPLPARAIAALLEADVVATEELCEALCERARLLSREPGAPHQAAPRYLPVHALVLDAALALVPSERRRLLHRRVAEHLARSAHEETRDLAHVLAIHLERAGEPQRAAEACARAAEQAARRYAPREAALHAERGLRLVAGAARVVSSDATELRLQLVRGNARMALHGTADQELVAIFERARALAHEIDDDAHRGRALLGLQGYYGVRNLALSSELAGEVLRIAADTGHLALESEGEMAHGLADFYRGQLAQAEHHYERAERAMAARLVAGDLGASADSAALHARRAIVSQLRGEPERALLQAEAGLAAAHQRDDYAQRARVQVLKGWLHLLRGEPLRSAHEAERALEAAVGEGLPYWEAGARVMRGAARLAQDDVHGALDDLESGLAAWRRLGVGLLYTYFTAFHGAALARLGRVDEALGALAEAEEATAGMGEAVMASEVLRLRASFVAPRAPDHALAQLSEAATLAQEQGAVLLRLGALSDLACLARRLERHEQARRAEVALRALCQGLGSDHGLPALRDARRLLGTLGPVRGASAPRGARFPRTAHE